MDSSSRLRHSPLYPQILLHIPTFHRSSKRFPSPITVKTEKPPKQRSPSSGSRRTCRDMACLFTKGNDFKGLWEFLRRVSRRKKKCCHHGVYNLFDEMSREEGFVKEALATFYRMKEYHCIKWSCWSCVLRRLHQWSLGRRGLMLPLKEAITEYANVWIANASFTKPSSPRHFIKQVIDAMVTTLLLPSRDSRETPETFKVVSFGEQTRHVSARLGLRDGVVLILHGGFSVLTVIVTETALTTDGRRVYEEESGYRAENY
ncbi:hypothetical protein Bca101_006628 [Brassica carinata]